MITYDAYGPHDSGSGPVWIVNAPAADYPDGRFDGVTPPPSPQQPTPPICEICDQPIGGFWHRNIGGGAVCPDCCPICANKRIADAARRALPDIETVFRKWGYIQTHPLPELRALLDMLTPPAPKWTATEEPE